MSPYKEKHFCRYDQVNGLDMEISFQLSFTDKKNSPKCINKQNDEVSNIL